MKKYLTLGVVALALIAIILFIVKVLPGAPQYRFGNDRAAVIKQMQSLSRLETASFSIDKIIEVSTDYNQLKQFFFGDKLLLVANGKVIAGFDLSLLKSSDFAGTGSSVTLTLPKPQILETILDNTKTRVFDREQGLFTKGDINLEAEARQQAERAITNTACQGGILQEATANAEKQLKVILKSAGFESITIITPTGTCL